MAGGALAGGPRAVPRPLGRHHLAIMILLIGFWRTAFIVLCGGVGLYIGRKADREPDFFGRIADEFLDRINRLR